MSQYRGKNTSIAVRSMIRMLIPLSKQSDALEILGAICAQIQIDPNCLWCRIYRGAEEQRAIMIEECWSNDESLLQHLRSNAYHRVLLVVEMAEEPPEIRFDDILQSSGIEKIENARKRPMQSKFKESQ